MAAPVPLSPLAQKKYPALPIIGIATLARLSGATSDLIADRAAGAKIAFKREVALA